MNSQDTSPPPAPLPSASSMDAARLAEIVAKVAEAIKATTSESKDKSQESLPSSTFPNVDQAVAEARRAQLKLCELSLEQRRTILLAMRQVAASHAKDLAERSVAETGMGNITDKIKTHHLVVDKTPGLEDLKASVSTGDHGLTLVEHSPFGVMAALTPASSPSETVICNALGMIAAGNAVVIHPSRRAQRTTQYTVALLNQAIVSAGGPDKLLCCIAQANPQTAQTLITHPDIDAVVTTGGVASARAALCSGKKTIAAGAGNPPVIVDETADLAQAARHIVDGAAFNHNILCVSEKVLIVVDSVADFLIHQLKKSGALHLTHASDIHALESALLDKTNQPNAALIGKSASRLLQAASLPATAGIRLITMELAADHPFVMQEMMMPVLPIVRVPDVQSAIALARTVERGLRHTAIMHSKNIDNLTLCARTLQTAVFVKNAPSYAGIGMGGEGFASFTIAGPTGEGLTSARTFSRIRRCVLAESFLIR